MLTRASSFCESLGLIVYMSGSLPVVSELIATALLVPAQRDVLGP